MRPRGVWTDNARTEGSRTADPHLFSGLRAFGGFLRSSQQNCSSRSSSTSSTAAALQQHSSSSISITAAAPHQQQQQQQHSRTSKMEGPRKGYAAVAEGPKIPAMIQCFVSVLLTLAAAAGTAARHIPVLRDCCSRRHSSSAAGATARTAARGGEDVDLEEGGMSLRQLRGPECVPKGVRLQMHAETATVRGLSLEGEGLAIADTSVEQDRCLFVDIVARAASAAVSLLLVLLPQLLSFLMLLLLMLLLLLVLPLFVSLMLLVVLVIAAAVIIAAAAEPATWKFGSLDGDVWHK
ncbi:hypothetical protein ACSSS7_006509 [Eimeria intestinalis]